MHRIEEREIKIQKLLRHAFVCLQKSNCTCSRNIKDFLSNDTISLKWVKEAKRNES